MQVYRPAGVICLCKYFALLLHVEDNGGTSLEGFRNIKLNTGLMLQFLTEAAATLGRRSRGKTEDVWLQSPLYPEYYRTFHYQARHTHVGAGPHWCLSV